MKKFIRKHPFRMLIALLLLIVSSLDNIIIAEAFKQLYQVIENKNIDLLLPVFLKMVTLYAMVSIAEFSFNVCQAKLIEIYNVEKKDELYRSSLLKNNLWNNTDTGEFLSLMTNDMKFLEGNYFKVLFQITKMVFYVSFSIIYAFYLDFYLALIFIICSIVSAVVPKMFGRKIQSASSSWTKHNSVYTNQLKENALGKETIIGYGVEEISIANVKKVNQGMEESLKKMSIIVAFSNSSVGFIATVGFLFPELIGVYWVVIGKLSLGVLLALMQVSNTIVGPCLAMLRHYNSLQSAKPILNKIEKLIKTESPPTNERLLEGHIKSIEFQNVNIGYEDKIVLKDINLNIKSGEKVLIIGESGCGKSSLLNAIKGTAQIINGSLSINDENRLSLNNRSVLSKISLIQQKIFLFDDTLAKNITLGENYEESEIIKACDQAGLLNVIEEKGLYFHVGENGKYLSGGQQQRVEIARAFLRGRELVLIDEATSNLDKEKANEIRQTYLNMDQTVIEVAHYIDSQFINCYDQIIVLSEGGIVEFGNVDSLALSKNSYLNKVLLV